MINKQLYLKISNRHVLNNIDCPIVFHGEGNHDRQNANHS